MVRAYFLVIVLLFGGLQASEAPASSVLDVDAYFKNLSNFNGAVLIMRGGEVLLKAGYGFANQEFGVPNTVETRFRLASVSKLFAALAILNLQEVGKLSVDDKLAAHIYGFDDRITLHQLLTHTAGIQDYLAAGRWETIAHYDRLMWMVDAAVRVWPLLHEPGSGCVYSNTGYLILARVIEIVSGMSYADFMRTQVLERFGMARAGCALSEVVVPMLASGYVLRKEAVHSASAPRSPLTLAGNGDLYASLNDMEKFFIELQRDISLRDKLFGSAVGSVGYGCCRESDESPRVVSAGALHGFLSQVAYYPSVDVATVLLMNVEDADLYAAADRHLCAYASSL